jgi:hypothetical protein
LLQAQGLLRCGILFRVMTDMGRKAEWRIWPKP